MCLFIDLQSAKTNMNVEQVFFTIARDIKQRLSETTAKPEVSKKNPFIMIPYSICRYIVGSIITNVDIMETLMVTNRQQQMLF